MATGKLREYGELLGLFAVVLSIVLLGYEVRQTRTAILGATYLDRAIDSAEGDRAYIESDHMFRVDFKVVEEGWDALTPAEQHRHLVDLGQKKTLLDAYFYQYELGLLDEEYFQYILQPVLKSMKDVWERANLLEDENTRPSFKAAVLAAAAED